MKKILLIYLLFLLAIPLIIAVPPFQASTTGGISIEYPKYDYIKLNNEFRFHVHVINATSTKTNTTTSCFIHVYNQTGYDIDTNINLMEFEAYNGIDFAKTISGNNFSSLGIYSYVIQCNSSNEIGFISGQLNVTPSGIEITTYKVLTFYLIIGIILIISLLLFYYSLKIELLIIKLFCLSLSIILIVFSIGYVTLIMNEVLGNFTQLTSLFTPIYILFITFVTVGGIGLIIFLIAYSLDSFYRHRGLKL